MLRWILAALAVPVLGLALSILLSTLDAKPYDHPRGPPRAYGPNTLSDEPPSVPLVALLAAPERYEGRKVRVEGFLSLEFENTALYADRQSWAAGLRSNALRIHVPDWAPPTTMHAVTRRYGAVEGTFTAKDGPDYGFPAGGLGSVGRIDLSYTHADHQRSMVRTRHAVVRQDLLSGWFLSVVGWTGLWLLWVMRRKA